MERLEELRRQVAWAQTFGLPLSLITAQEAQDRFPLMSLVGVLGAVWLPTDGWLDPSSLALALAAGARARGATIRQGARVVAIHQERGRVTGVTVEDGGERHEVRTRIVVNADGMYAPDVAKLAGVTVPIVPMAHQYAFTDAIPGVHAGLPQLRDPDNLVYVEPVRVDGQVMGRVTSGGFGFAVERSVAYAYLPADLAAVGTRAEIDVFGTQVGATVTAEPLWDPWGARIRA